MAASVDQFGKAMVASGLLTADEVKHVWAETTLETRPKDGVGFARLLVERGMLTEYQAAQILAGRGSALLMGEYVVLQELGAGGMGQVFKAQHRRMKRIVALKVMSTAAMKDESSVKRFQREVEAAARLEHPNIVTAYDAGRAGNVAFLVMQFVDGGDLSGLVKKQGPLEIERAVDYVVQAARGLAYAHGEGVIHRDIKPANLLCDKKGVVKILDMGLARLDKGDDGLTATEQVMGTVDYMSPEQASNTKTADARSDVYSLGCTLWYLLTGRKTYDGDSMIERLMAHREQPLPSLVKARDDASWPLEQAFHKMIAKRAADRFQTMDEVVAALEPFAGGGSRSGTSGMGSSLGMGSGPHDAELSAFLRTVGPAASKTSPPSTASKTAVPNEATAQFVKPEVDTDPKSEIHVPTAAAKGIASSRGGAAKPQAKGSAAKAKPPIKWIAAGVGGAAVLVVAAIVFFNRSGEPEASAPGGLSATNNAPVAHAPGSPAVAPLPTWPLNSRTSSAPISFLASDAPTAAPPPGDYALSFAENGEVSVPSLSFDSSGPVTIECWFRQTHDRRQGAVGFLGINKRFWLSLKRGETIPTVHAYVDVNYEASDVRRVIPRDQPVHIAGVRAGNQIRLYVDGKLSGTSDAIQGPLFDAKTSFTIGRNAPGLINEVRVSKVARYDKEFQPQARFESDADTLALFHFDEGYGAVVQDASGNKRDGQVLGAKWVQADGSPVPPPIAPATPAGPPPGDYALLFDGNGVVEFDDPLPYAIDSFTIEAYVRPDSPVIRAVICSLSERGELGFDHGEGKEWSIRHAQLPSEKSKVGGHYSASGRMPAEIGKRVHLAGVGSSTRFELFLDGKSIGRTPPMEGRAFALGKKPPNIGSLFKGVIDEVRISKSIRYTDEFTPASRHEPDADTLALYHCDEGAGSVLKDASGNNRHGRIVSAKWVTASGSAIPATSAGHFALEFDGTGGVTVDSLNVDLAKPLTIEAFVKPALNGNEGPEQVILGTVRGFLLRLSAKTGRPVLAVGHHQKLDFPFFQLTTNTDLDRTRTRHWAAVWNVDKVQWFIDGKLIGERAEKLPAAPAIIRNLQIGVQYAGRLDEIRVSQVARYDRDFTPQPRFEPDADTLVLYHCDEGTGGVLRDASGNNHHVPFSGAKFVAADAATTPARPAAALAPVAPADVFLDDLPEKSWKGYALLGKHGRYLNNATVNRGGKRVEHSLFTSPEGGEGFVEYDLPAGYGSFRAVVYLLRTPSGPQTFEVVGDGKVLWSSEPQTTPNAEIDVDLDVRNVKVLRLVISGISSNSHPVWVDPRLIPIVAASTPTNAPAPAAAMSPSSAADGKPTPIDLLAGVDPVRDAVVGTFSLVGGLAPTDGTLQARIFVSRDPLSAEYDLHVSVERTTVGGKAFVIGFPSQTNQGMLVVDGFSNPPLSGLELVDGKNAKESGVFVSGERMPIGAVHKIWLRIRQDGVAASVDGAELFNWKGRPDQLSTHAMWAVPDKSRIFVGFQGPYRVRTAQLVPVAAP